MRRYTVYKGNHYCLHGQWMHFNKTGMIVNFAIDPESSYKLDVADQPDINKIGGVTFGLAKVSTNPLIVTGAVHINSIRLGMCGDLSDPSLIYVYLYYYENGVEKNVLIKKSLYGIYNSYYISWDRSMNIIKVVDRMGNTTVKVPFDFTNVPTWGFYCYPYFGGTCVAPVDYTVDLLVTTTNA